VHVTGPQTFLHAPPCSTTFHPIHNTHGPRRTRIGTRRAPMRPYVRVTCSRTVLKLTRKGAKISRFSVATVLRRPVPDLAKSKNDAFSPHIPLDRGKIIFRSIPGTPQGGCKVYSCVSMATFEHALHKIFSIGGSRACLQVFPYNLQNLNRFYFEANIEGICTRSTLRVR
jgi:hypothetical protein